MTKTERRINAYVRRLYDVKNWLVFVAEGHHELNQDECKAKVNKAREDCKNLEVKLVADGVNTDELKARCGIGKHLDSIIEGGA